MRFLTVIPFAAIVVACGTETVSRSIRFVDLERAGPSSTPPQTTALRL